jgi:hypothetical protein
MGRMAEKLMSPQNVVDELAKIVAPRSNFSETEIYDLLLAARFEYPMVDFCI